MSPAAQIHLIDPNSLRLNTVAMTIQFGYNKKQVLDGLRGHFFSRPEIKILSILINVFAILSAILFYFKKIQAMPFLLFSVLWFLLWISVRRLLPLSIYKKSATFQDTFILSLKDQGILLETQRGTQVWQWEVFSGFKETAYFFHLYFDSRSFFLIPKDSFRDITEIQAARQLLKDRIRRP
jgi:YcxB-like protein